MGFPLNCVGTEEGMLISKFCHIRKLLIEWNLVNLIFVFSFQVGRVDGHFFVVFF